MSYSTEVKKLLEEGAKSYASKNFEVAIENYGEACQLYSQDHDGEEDPDLLLLYGKALFQLAQSRNGLFGGNPDATDDKEGEAGTDADAKPSNANGMFTFSEDVPLAEEEDEDENPAKEEEEEQDEEEDEEEEGAKDEKKDTNEEEEEQSDFEVAWEILDLARALFESQIGGMSNDIPQDINKSQDPVIQTKLKLSEIYDLLGEISLETENFKQASDDFESLLKVRESLYQFNSNMISEAHYKLSLALEFNFDDKESKEKAITHLKLSIESIKQNTENAEKNKDVVKDLEIRLEDLQKDPNEIFNQQKQEIMEGILGEAVSSPQTKKPTSTQPVNDLTSMVKKRKIKPGKTDVNKKTKQ